MTQKEIIKDYTQMTVKQLQAELDGRKPKVVYKSSDRRDDLIAHCVNDDNEKAEKRPGNILDWAIFAWLLITVIAIIAILVKVL